ncbi:hypothetical protein IB235_06365 [Paracoccus sp. PAR01]|nr:hypothetical protein [Paracoccus sp. PAR01]
MARIWLHIGMMKTGTSALQEWFATHEETLLAQRLLYVRVKPKLPASMVPPTPCWLRSGRGSSRSSPKMC